MNKSKIKTMGKTLHDCTEKLLMLKKDIGKNLFIMGAILKKIRDDGLYVDQYEGFESYLGDPEISIGRSTAFKAIKVYEIFEPYFSKFSMLNQIEHEKLYLISGFVKKEPNKAEEWVKKAQTLSRTDLKDAIREAKGKIPKHSLSIHKKIKMFLDEIQPRDYIPNKRDDNWESCFTKLLLHFHEFRVRI